MSDNNKNIKADYETSRETYLDLISKGQEGIDEMVEVARQLEHPRAFEVLATMIKNVADVTDKLMDLNKKNKDIVSDPKEGTKGVTNNNVFIGSASDLQRMLQENNEKVIEHDGEQDPQQTSE